MKPRRAVIWLTALSVAFRMLFPAGFMPGSLADGWAVQVCHQGLPQGALHGASGHQHHGADHDHPQSYDSTQLCPLGLGFDSSYTLPSLTLFGPQWTVGTPPEVETSQIAAVRPGYRPPARAPPAHLGTV